MANCAPADSLPKDIQARLVPSYRPFILRDGDGESHKVYARTLHGKEKFFALVSETGLGFFMYTGGASVAIHSLGTPDTPFSDRESILSAIRRSWIRLRHLAPSIACRTFGTPDAAANDAGAADDEARANEGYHLVYEPPRDHEAAERWARETVVTYPEFEWDLRAMEAHLSGNYWQAEHGRYCLELHVAEDRNKEELLLFLHGPHFCIDGRCSLMLIDDLLHFIVEDLNDPTGAARSLDTLDWGTEVERLPPAAGLAIRGDAPFTKVDQSLDKGLDKTRTDPDHCVDSSANTDGRSSGSATLFLRPAVPAPSSGSPLNYEHPTSLPRSRSPPTCPNVYSTLSLSREETAAFRAACKSRGRTVTTVIDAIMVLSEVETVMRRAAAELDHNGGPAGATTRWLNLKKMYDEVEFVSTNTVVDMRPSMPAAYASLQSEKSTPTLASHSLTHLHPMDSVRKAVIVTGSTSSKVEVKVDFSESTFWESVVCDSAKLWTNQKPSPETFAENEAAIDAGLSGMLNPAQFCLPALAFSSPGDFDAMGVPVSPSGRYGILGRWNESVRGPVAGVNGSLGAIVDARVSDITLSVRTHNKQTIVWECFKYNGRLTLHIFGSSGWHRQAEINKLREAASRWISRVCKV